MNRPQRIIRVAVIIAVTLALLPDPSWARPPRVRHITKAIRTNVRQALRKPQLRIQSRHAQALRGLAVSSSGKLLAINGSNDTTTLWNLETGQRIQGVSLKGTPQATAFSADDRRLIGLGSYGSWRA
ncbi:MAG: hypothetical protein HQL50_04990, partial [Magnetococcales bacterium]|nr:hypothetical protein [Magnetococcales bacterium]